MGKVGGWEPSSHIELMTRGRGSGTRDEDCPGLVIRWEERQIPGAVQRRAGSTNAQGITTGGSHILSHGCSPEPAQPLMGGGGLQSKARASHPTCPLEDSPNGAASSGRTGWAPHPRQLHGASNLISILSRSIFIISCGELVPCSFQIE